MGWVRLDDLFPEHPKVLKAGAAAAWLHVCGVAYCARNLTDGFIPEAKVTGLADLKRVSSEAKRLVEAGLWHKVEGGYMVHDYLDWQRSADEAKAVSARRAAAGRRGGQANGRATAKQNASGLLGAVLQQPPSKTEADVEGEGKNYKDNSTVVLTNDDSAGEEADEVRQVFDAWVEATGRSERTVFDPKRRRQVKTALKTYPLDELLDTVRGWRHDPHNRGENTQGKIYNDLGLLLRDAEHIEKFRDLERKSKGRTAATGPYDDTAERLKRAYA